MSDNDNSGDNHATDDDMIRPIVVRNDKEETSRHSRAIAEDEPGEPTEAKEDAQEPEHAEEAKEKTEEAPEKEAKPSHKQYEERLDAMSEEEREEEAKKQGWKPDGRRTAKEYLEISPFAKALANSRRAERTKDLAIQELAQQMKEQRQAGYEQALRDLNNEFEENVLKGDVEAAKETNDKMTKLQQSAPSDNSLDSADPEVIDAFSEEHRAWILDETSYQAKEVRDFFTSRDMELKKKNIPVVERLEIIDKDIRYKYPGMVQNYDKPEPQSERKAVPIVDVSTAAPAATKDKITFNSLSPDEKRVAREFEAQGVMSIEKFVERRNKRANRS